MAKWSFNAIWEMATRKECCRSRSFSRVSNIEPFFFSVSEPINEIQECVVLMNLHIQTNTYNVCRNTNRVIKNLKQKQQMKWLKNTIGLEWNGHCIYKIEVIITKWDRQAWRNLYIYDNDCWVYLSVQLRANKISQ